MPELPDLLHIQKYLNRKICTGVISDVELQQPVVLRNAIDEDYFSALSGLRIDQCFLRGPFIRLELSNDLDLIFNLMLAGKLQHQLSDEKPGGYLCLSFHLDDGSSLNLCDEQKMAKVYLVHHGNYSDVPKFREQGVDILGKDFTQTVLKTLATKHSRKQVRVFINDHTILSSVGNAYADEILFDARIHPKTFVNKLSSSELEQLYDSIRTVMQWGIEQVEKAGQPIHVKVRDHMRVRNRKDQPCTRCGTRIRREGVRGFDVFFCPECQRATRKLFIDWSTANQR